MRALHPVVAGEVQQMSRVDRRGFFDAFTEDPRLAELGSTYYQFTRMFDDD